MRDEHKAGGGLAVVLAVLMLSVFCLFALGGFLFFARIQAQRAMAAEKRAAEVHRLAVEAMEKRMELEKATTPKD